MNPSVKPRFDFGLFWVPIFVLVIIVAGGELIVGRYRFLSRSALLVIIGLAVLLEAYTFYEERHKRHNRALVATTLLVATVTAIEIDGVVHLITLLLSGGQGVRGASLLASGAYFWATNVLAFALWFWLIDRGGPNRRADSNKTPADFFFPEMAAGNFVTSNWRPSISGYLYLAFTNATAFSPTDTLPLSSRARMLMTAESVISLVIIALVFARGVNILQ